VSTLCENAECIKRLIEQAQTLANRSEQTTALYISLDGKLEVEVIGALDGYERILETFQPYIKESWELNL